MIKSICFLTTYQCNAQCDYCECRPEVEARISGPDLIRFIDEAHALGTVGQVIFSGGEPTLLKHDLFKAIRHATDKGMVTRVVTNGWWGGKKAEIGLAYLDRFIDAGLSELNISVDQWHQDWIPLTNVRNAFLACVTRQFPCLIGHKAALHSRQTKEDLEAFFGVDLIYYHDGGHYSAEEHSRLFLTGPIVPVGPTAMPIRDEDLKRIRWRGSCGSVFKDIVVGADYQLQPCCGIVTKGLPELTLGDVRDTPMLDLIEAGNNDAVLSWLALEGPAAIADFVEEKEPEISFKDSYVSICHICNEVLTRPDVRKALRKHLPERLAYLRMHREVMEQGRSTPKLAETYIR
jgi:hypothetical protein